jgi:hypothetical protein
VTTGHTKPQMNPVVTAFKTLLTSAGMRLHILYGVNVRATFHLSPILLVKLSATRSPFVSATSFCDAEVVRLWPLIAPGLQRFPVQF